MTKKVAKWRVDEIEYEPGWGVRVDGSHYFDTNEEAEAFVKGFNFDENGKRRQPAPSGWNMWAEDPVLVAVGVE